METDKWRLRVRKGGLLEDIDKWRLRVRRGRVAGGHR
jgi:hypothetical protein